MGEVEDKQKYNHLKALIAGSHKSGNPVRDQLIVSDAKRHMEDLLKKRPNIVFEEPVVEEVVEEVKEVKSKVKK